MKPWHIISYDLATFSSDPCQTSKINTWHMCVRLEIRTAQDALLPPAIFNDIFLKVECENGPQRQAS